MLQNMQKAVLSGSLNIARTFKASNITENCSIQYVGRDSRHSQRLLFINGTIDFIITFFSLNSQRATHTRPVILSYL